MGLTVYADILKSVCGVGTVADAIQFTRGRSEHYMGTVKEFDVVVTSPPWWEDFKETGSPSSSTSAYFPKTSTTLIENYEGTEVGYRTFMMSSLIPVMKGCFAR